MCYNFTCHRIIPSSYKKPYGNHNKCAPRCPRFSSDTLKPTCINVVGRFPFIYLLSEIIIQRNSIIILSNGYVVLSTVAVHLKSRCPIYQTIERHQIVIVCIRWIPSGKRRAYLCDNITRSSPILWCGKAFVVLLFRHHARVYIYIKKKK